MSRTTPPPGFLVAGSAWEGPPKTNPVRGRPHGAGWRTTLQHRIAAGDTLPIRTMGADPQQQSTEVTQRSGQASGAPAPLRPTSVPALTILYHPALRRIGDRAVLGEIAAGRAAQISRGAPRFAPPRQPRSAPLDHPRISRVPFALHPRGDLGLLIDPGQTRTRITVDGELVDRPRLVSSDQLERGVLVELADRIALLLHQCTPRATHDAGDFGLVGHSDPIGRVRDDVRRVAALDVPVLIRGETGTGKELVATAIHASGSRAQGPLVCVNMAALPPTLAAAELFGAARGAFTGAARGQDGYFRRASGGTLFLDEIAAAAHEVQVMLLRALETSEVFPLGAQRPEQVDVRIIAATDARLEALVASGGFGAPLLYRLAGYEIHLTSLRERRDDIARLLMHFLGLDLAETGDSALLDRSEPTPWLPLALVRWIMQYHWPGNVRQLRNVVRQIVIASRGEPEAALPPALRPQLPEGAPAAPARPSGGEVAPGRSASGGRRPRDRKPADITEDELVDALCAHRWDVKSTAAALGISRTSLYKLIEASDRVGTAGHLDVEEIRSCHRDLAGDLDAMVDRLRVSKPALRRRIRELGLP